MANQSTGDYELYGEYQAVSVGSKPYRGQADEPDPDGPRSITLMQQPGDESDPYGGHKQVGLLHGVEVSEVPDGRQLEPEDHPAYGYDDDATYCVYVKPGGERDIATVAKKTTGAGQ